MAIPTTLDTKLKPRWHPLPAYHLKALKGWMNDPCAPGYDATTGTYHLFYQWNPKSCDWGDICWGHFTSRDGVQWEHNGKSPALEPSQPYDKLGIFTGCMYSTGPRGERDQLTLVYSSIEHLPIHWTLPHVRNCAGLALATSCDGGRTWRKSDLNPILKGEPEGISVTGFRDPYLSEWSAMDSIRGEKESKLYGVVSGGIVGQGPNAFVYSVDPHDLTTWKYLGPLVDIPVGFQRPDHWNGDFGLNWECVNFMTLGDGLDEYEVLTICSEGGLKRKTQEVAEEVTGVWTLWVAGSLKHTGSGVVLEHDFSGILDHGNLYAPNSYQHPHTGARIVWGWIKEEELPLSRRESKGWTGYLSLPRELFILRLPSIVRALKTPLSEIPSMKISKDESAGGRTKTLQTLGIRPSPSLKTLRRSNPIVWSKVHGHGQARRAPRHLHSTRSVSWELEAIIKVQHDTHRIGFHIRHNEDFSQRTTIFFFADEEQIVVDRSWSNQQPEIRKDLLSGPFTLFVRDCGGDEVIEDLRIRLFYDGDVLEIFANDRFALSTAVYADTHTCTGISCFVDGNGGKSGEGMGSFDTVMLWECLGNVRTAVNGHL